MPPPGEPGPFDLVRMDRFALSSASWPERKKRAGFGPVLRTV